MMKKLYFSIVALLLCLIWAHAEQVTTPWRGVDYSFNFCDGSIFPTTNPQAESVDYGIFRYNKGTGSVCQYNGAQHGVEFKAGNTIELDVAGSVTIKIGGCQYSGSTSTITVSDKNGTYTETRLSKTATCDATLNFTYEGPKTTLVIANAVGKTYIPKIDVLSAPVISDYGETYSYNFADASIFPQVTTTRYPMLVTSDGIVTLNSNSDNTNLQFWWHDTSHGIVMYPTNSIKFVVPGKAVIKIGTCQYTNATDAIFEFADEAGNVLGSISATDKGTATCTYHSFSYKGEAGVVTATLRCPSTPTVQAYISGVIVENEKAKSKLIDAWDFGAAQLDTSRYNNLLNEAVINGWYDPSIVVGSASNTFPASFTAGALKWIGAANKDRLRTSNTNLTRYDANGAPMAFGNDTLTGSLYVNASATTARYLSIDLSEDDEVTIYCKSQNAAGLINFVYSNPSVQTDTCTQMGTGTIVKFVARNTGTYSIWDTKDKPSYYRILRKDATMVKVTGTVDASEAPGIPAGYKIEFKNKAGKAWQATVSEGSYTGKIPAGYEYSLSLIGANGYVISNGITVTVDSDTTRSIAIKKVEMYTVSGSIVGLNTTQLSKLKLSYTPSTGTRIYVPETTVDANTATYTAKLEPNCNYAISATGVNDFIIPENSITIQKADTTANITFTAKPVFPVTLAIEGLDTIKQSKLIVTFTNLNEAGYTYSFADLTAIALRNGVYSISVSGLEQYPVELGATSNLTINQAAGEKTLVFKRTSFWNFDDVTITNQNPAYKGLLFTGNIYNEKAKSHLVTKAGASIQVPMNPGERLTIIYYYSAKFSIAGGDTIITTSGSTSTFESTSYQYSGTEAGYVTIGTGSGTSYFPDIYVVKTIPYDEVITVGVDKDYQTISGALDGVRSMIRPTNERVNILIDPGNYEEMLMIDVVNVTFTNAATTPSIALLNKGVDIDPAAVRITGYYGHGYNYYSMGSNQKWSADALRVNKENGSTPYTNTGAASTNGSYWNATVVVTAPGFEANNIIFENSFNQYISKKESEDVVKEWASGGKGTRPTTYRSTDVQNRNFVERAAALAITKTGDKTVLNNCRVIGRQDSFYGAEGARVVAYKGVLMGAVDYIFGGMTLVCFKTDLAMNTSEASIDVAYLTAAQQTTARGFLMYECRVTSAIPGNETASTFISKPGYFGRPWQGTTSEVVFYKTTIDTTNFTGSAGKSLIVPEAWNNTLGGPSNKCYEYETIELSKEDNSTKRASWSHVLSTPILSDGVEITTFNFTKGTDNWDPIPALDAVIPDFVVEKVVFGKVDSPEDYTCNLNLRWNAEKVFIILDIADDSIVNSGTNYQVDNIEVYFDMDNSKNIHWPRNGGWVSSDPTYDANDYQLRLVPGVEFSTNNSLAEVTQVYNATEKGYRFELTIPWSSLLDGFIPEVGTKIGFDILASDNDAVASDANRNQVTLVSPTTNPFNDPSLFGTFQFEESGKFSIIPDTETPGIASNLTATADNKHSVTLAWENATDNIAILYYNVYQGNTLLPTKVYPKETGNTLKISNLEDGSYSFTLETVDNFGNISTSKATVTVMVTTVSVNDLTSSKLLVYPNPATSQLTIKGVENISRVEVIGLAGNVVKSFNGSSAIDVSDLSKGAYMIKVYSENKSISKRFLKN
jgi:pectin methylesterase-like acyl-CoA thioesterase